MIEPVFESTESVGTLRSAEPPSRAALGQRATFVRVVLPAYNESQSLGRLIPRIDETLRETYWDYDILIVDDGSSDDTVEVARELQAQSPIRIVCHQGNQGLGAAIT